MEALQQPSHVGRQPLHEGHWRTSGVHAQHSKKPSNLAQFLHFVIIVWCKYVNIQRHKKDVSSFFFFFSFKATVGMFSGAENKWQIRIQMCGSVSVYIFLVVIVKIYLVHHLLLCYFSPWFSWLDFWQHFFFSQCQTSQKYSTNLTCVMHHPPRLKCLLSSYQSR